jgi:hypothetical protein
MTTYQHTVTAWTVGQLRLAAYDSDLPLSVAVPDQPAGPLGAGDLVVTGTQRWLAADAEHAEHRVTLETDYPTVDPAPGDPDAAE